MELSGKLTILTGASRGIGRALEVELARSGCGLLLTALEGDELSALSQEIRRRFSVNVAGLLIPSRSPF
jgi:3-oxoacyl-[acyl-carrier protein] reductase